MRPLSPEAVSLVPFSELSHAAPSARWGLIALVGTEGGQRRAPLLGAASDVSIEEAGPQARDNRDPMARPHLATGAAHQTPCG